MSPSRARMVKTRPGGVLGQLVREVHASVKVLTHTSLIYAALTKNPADSLLQLIESSS